MIHNDHLGTPQKMTDGSGTVVWSADYKPFGETTITVSTITSNLRFLGQYFDAETGLNYNYYRNYNPFIGRYVEADPLNLRSFRVNIPKRTEAFESLYKFNPSKQSLYIYVSNNSIAKIDPSGLAEEWPTYDLPPGAGRIPQWPTLSPKAKCKISCKVATIIPCVAGGVGIAVGTDDPQIGYTSFSACNWYFTFLCTQICSCQQ